MPERVDCIVIGAGAAGLAAGEMLQLAGARFLILEARDRIGGRAHSFPLSDGSMAERGAQYLHGARIATWEYVVRYSLTTHFAAGPSSVVVPEFSAGEWRPHGNPETTDAYMRMQDAFDIADGDDVSVHDALVRAGFSAEQLEAAEARMRIMSPLEPELVSARAGAAAWRLVAPTTANFVIVEGYGGLWERMSAPWASRIRLDTPVTAIEWSPAGVVVEAGAQRYEATTAVVTLPVGVLQSGAVTFRPGPPERKQAAIEGLRMGAIVKIVAEFRRAFWEDLLGPVAGFWAADYPFSVTRMAFPDRPGPPALVTFIGANPALTISGDAERLAEFFLQSLEDMYPDVGVRSLLVHLEIVDWPADPWARGAVSVEPVGGAHLRADLAAPTAPLFWAGEAVALDGGAECVHGALSTGRRAALDALHLVRPLSITEPARRLDWSRYID